MLSKDAELGWCQWMAPPARQVNLPTCVGRTLSDAILGDRAPAPLFAGVLSAFIVAGALISSQGSIAFPLRSRRRRPVTLTDHAHLTEGLLSARTVDRSADR